MLLRMCSRDNFVIVIVVFCFVLIVWKIVQVLRNSTVSVKNYCYVSCDDHDNAAHIRFIP